MFEHSSKKEKKANFRVEPVGIVYMVSRERVGLVGLGLHSDCQGAKAGQARLNFAASTSQARCPSI